MESRVDTPPLIAIVGETASGKTAVAIEIAKRIDGEIICADSRTVYKQMDIGTAKPSRHEQTVIPHHLLSLIEPNQTFSAAQFKEMAEKCIQDISSRGRIPIIVGGTGLYIDGLLYNFHFGDKVDAAYRAELEQMEDVELTTILSTKNIDTAGLDIKNRRHTIRAIEQGGKRQTRELLRKNTIILGIKLDRELLRKRIIQRVECMFEEGFIEEATKLFSLYGRDNEAFLTPGYRAAAAFIEGQLTLNEAKSQFIASDLKLAKRQRTWFKRNTDIQWFDDPDELAESALAFIDGQRV